MTPRSTVEILAPTALEYWAARTIVRGVRTRQVGIGLAGWSADQGSELAIVCGLAGSLIPSLKPGTVIVPDLVCMPSGSVLRADPVLHDAMVRGGRSLGFNPETGPLLTAPSIVAGEDRERWSERGFVAADMEGALVAERLARSVTVRVVLDSPSRSLSDLWLSPRRAAMTPALWPELAWLAWAAPLYALRAARVVRAGLATLASTGSAVRESSRV